MADPAEKDLVFFDGQCGLCHAGVRFLLTHDADGSRFVYAPLHGRTFEEHLTPGQRAGLPDSIVVLRPSGQILVRSEGTFYLLGRLGGAWALLGKLGALLPRAIGDAGYICVARVRRIFGRPKTQCPVPQAEQRGRFFP